VLGLEFDAVRNGALIAVAVVVVLVVAAAWIVKAIVGKLVVIALLGALAAVVWSQREALVECADRVGATLYPGAVDDTTCTFLGRDVTVTAPFGD
jgi:hypothetical protein